MKVSVDQPLRSEESTIPPGEYEIDVDEERSAILFKQDGDIVASASALKRPTGRRVFKSNVELREIEGESRRLLLARTPPGNEWVVPLFEED